MDVEEGYQWKDKLITLYTTMSREAKAGIEVVIDAGRSRERSRGNAMCLRPLAKLVVHLAEVLESPNDELFYFGR